MKTVIEIRDGVRTGALTSEQIVRECLEKIHREDEKIGAFLETFDDEALARAKEIDSYTAQQKSALAMCGVPVAIKDNMCYLGHISSCGSKMLEKYRGAYSATVVERLLAAGAVIIGRVNMDEFAAGSSTETSFWKKTHNPVDVTKVPGGSSGGSAAAVAAGFVPVALGSDTGGSIRQPASLCGVVGMKPTYGRVSRYGLIAMASSFDQIGPIATTVADVALVLQVIEGQDERDATSIALPGTTAPELLTRSVAGLKIGVPKEYFIDGMDEEVRARVMEAIEKLKELGAEIKEISLPLTSYALPVYYIIQPAEVSSNYERFDGLRYGTRAESPSLKESYLQARGTGFGREVKRRIMLGAYILSAGYYDAYYKKAQAVKTAIYQDLMDVFEHVDVIVTPTSPSVAWNLGERFDDPIAMYLADIFTVTANIAGTPGISVPCGTAHGLPVGLQFLGPYLGDAKVLDAASAFEAAIKK